MDWWKGKSKEYGVGSKEREAKGNPVQKKAGSR